MRPPEERIPNINYNLPAGVLARRIPYPQAPQFPVVELTFPNRVPKRWTCIVLADGLECNRWSFWTWSKGQKYQAVPYHWKPEYKTMSVVVV